MCYCVALELVNILCIWLNIGILLTECQLTVNRSGLMASLNTFHVVQKVMCILFVEKLKIQAKLGSVH